ncbi:hypothetical protein MN608_10253 [Microdochium nivale]|nr:hypothetical protein MN608_10253 [Microdochium nivale]
MRLIQGARETGSGSVADHLNEAVKSAFESLRPTQVTSATLIWSKDAEGKKSRPPLELFELLDRDAWCQLAGIVQRGSVDTLNAEFDFVGKIAGGSNDTSKWQGEGHTWRGHD